MDKLGSWMGRIASGSAAVAVLLVLRLTSAPSMITSDGLAVSALQFDTLEAERPLLSETARSRQISFTDFSTTELSPAILDNPFTLERADQLHVKDMYVSENSLVRMALTGMSLALVVGAGSRENSRSFARIGIGKKVWLKDVVSRHDLDASDGNIAVMCDAPSCAMVLNLLDPTIEELVRPYYIRRLSLRVAGSNADSDDAAQVSSIQEGKITVSATDLFGVPFAVRSLTLASGDSLLLDPDAKGRVRIDTRKGLFNLSLGLEGGQHRFVPRVGDEITLAPSMLEIMIREPWHKTIWGLVLTLIPLFIQLGLFVRSRNIRKLEKLQ